MTNDIAKRVAEAHLNKTAGHQAYARLGTVRFGPHAQAEMWLYVEIPGGDPKYISMNTIRNAEIDLGNAYTKLAKTLKGHNAKVIVKGQPFLIAGDRLEMAIGVGQIKEDTTTPLHESMQAAIKDARIRVAR